MKVVVVVDGEDDEDGAEVSSLEVRPSDKESLSVPRPWDDGREGIHWSFLTHTLPGTRGITPVCDSSPRVVRRQCCNGVRS
jgi:hypothetical protein